MNSIAYSWPKIITMSIHPKLKWKSNKIQIKIPVNIFKKEDKLILKFI